jgi:hypothetical protein
MRVADLEDTILDEVVKISHPSEAFSGIVDVCALVIRLAATNLLLSTDTPGLSFLHKYRQNAADMVGIILRSFAIFISSAYEFIETKVSHGS